MTIIEMSIRKNHFSNLKLYLLNTKNTYSMKKILISALLLATLLPSAKAQGNKTETHGYPIDPVPFTSVN